ncbi:MAG: hypothetical protein COB02_16300 [Candidatus Cloacimonadota bacterium]|nr:MAG: hypothetical protein COB02_16300 [Candidatus Cloacimonadota bacterium]
MQLLEEILTLKETSKYLRISSESLRTLIKKREIPVAKVGNQWRFKKSLIDQWIFNQCIEHITPSKNLPPTKDSTPTTPSLSSKETDFEDIL